MADVRKAIAETIWSRHKESLGYKTPAVIRAERNEVACCQAKGIAHCAARVAAQRSKGGTPPCRQTTQPNRATYLKRDPLYL